VTPSRLDAVERMSGQQWHQFSGGIDPRNIGYPLGAGTPSKPSCERVVGRLVRLVRLVRVVEIDLYAVAVSPQQNMVDAIDSAV
jgi:hypothetical protein